MCMCVCRSDVCMRVETGGQGPVLLRHSTLSFEAGSLTDLDLVDLARTSRQPLWGPSCLCLHRAGLMTYIAMFGFLWTEDPNSSS